MDFIGPLKTTSAGASYILAIVCYMSRFAVPFATKIANVEDVMWCLELLFAMYRVPHAFYLDRGQQFFNNELQEFFKGRGIAFDYSPAGSSKSTGMVEVTNKLLESVLRKDASRTGKEWDLRLPKDGSSLNDRVIQHLGVSPRSIMFGPLPEVSACISTLRALPGRDISEWARQMDDQASHGEAVRSYLTHRAELHDSIKQKSDQQKEVMEARYNKGINKTTHHLGDLVMLHQKSTGKLEPRWRGPFRIHEYGGAHGLSFVLRQLNGRKIKHTYHGDHLKKFTPRTGYLASHRDPSLQPEQTIRVRRRRVRLRLSPPKPPTNS